METTNNKEQEVEKELFEWVKASEELSIHMDKVCCKRVGFDHYFSAYWDFSRRVYVTYNENNSWIQKEDIEWLKPAALSHPTTTVLERKDLHEQVVEHIRNYKLFDWDEALTDNEMSLLEDMFMSFNPLCPPGSKGFEEQKRHIAQSQPSTVLGWVDDAQLISFAQFIQEIVSKQGMLNYPSIRLAIEVFKGKFNSTPTPTNETDRFPETLTEGQLKYYNEVSGALKRDYEEKMWLLKQKIMSDKDGG